VLKRDYPYGTHYCFKTNSALISDIYKFNYVFLMEFRAFALVLFYVAFYYYVVFVLFMFLLCICTLFVLYLCLCVGFIIGTCAVKLSH